MKKILVLCCSLLLLIAGCNKPDDEKAVNGVWQEKEIIGKFAGTSHWIRLNPDKTFELKLYRFTDMMDTAQTSCPNTRTDYIKGAYEINGTHIAFGGRYCNESFSLLQPNCRGETIYQSNYSINFVGNDMVFDFEKDDYRKVWLVKQ